MSFSFNKLCIAILSRLRIGSYKILSNAENVTGKPTCISPLLLNGNGKIIFGSKNEFGIRNSPHFFNSYCYIEARGEKAKVVFGNDNKFNNCFTAISEGQGIELGNKILIGSNVSIFDSDFHELAPNSRSKSGESTSKKVVIMDNVFIGSNVVILKGVRIGENSVIANNSVVTKDIPNDVIAGGNPARIIKSIS